VWAPDRKVVHLLLEDRSGTVQTEHLLEREGRGYFSGYVAPAGVGGRYRFRLDGGAAGFPDPASRFQPDGPHGPSEIVDPSRFVWSDGGWRGVSIHRQVLYELHVGTYTPQGTWRAAMEHLPDLADLGITVIEMMPVAEFDGRRGWGYDGVDLYAPSHLYGTPDDLRAYVDRAHALGIGVILDVVYNHLGPSGNYLAQFSTRYFTDRYENEWGDAINYDDNADGVREFMATNAAYWIDEFHMDGLRFDATQQFFDQSRIHILAEMSVRARRAAGRRSIILVAENEPQDVRALRPLEENGFGLDGLWNDDFHHEATVALTGHREAYYTDYLGSPQEFIALAKWGFIYQGQRYSWQRKRRGTPALEFDAWRFITFLQNHDQIANEPSGRGARLHCLSSPSYYRAMTALWLLMPGTPMFFQGQEFLASSPFRYFCDHTPELAKAVRAGRAEFMRQFASVLARGRDAVVDDPNDERVFQSSVLDHGERERHPWAFAFHRDLLALRRTERAIRLARRMTIDGTVIGERALALRFFAGNPREPGAMPADDDRLLIVNFGVDLARSFIPDPLLAPPADMNWTIRWSSEDPAYGGGGTAPPETRRGWRLPGDAAVLLMPVRS